MTTTRLPGDATGDSDASMSNDDEDAMSETSSLAIDDDLTARTISSIDSETIELLLQNASSSQPTSNGFASAPLSATQSTAPTSSVLDALRRPPSFSMAGNEAWSQESMSTPTTAGPALLSPRKRKRVLGASSMWLHVRFVPAMTKSAFRTTPPREIFPSEDSIDASTEGESSQQRDERTGPSAYSRPRNDRDRSSHLDDGMAGDPSRNGASTLDHDIVEWGDEASECVQHGAPNDGHHIVAARGQVIATQLRVLSSQPFLLATDTANWMLPQGHTPRCRVRVDTSFLPQAVRAEAFVIGYVQDETGEHVMEILDDSGYAKTLAYEHAVYIRVRVSDTATEGPYEVPIQVFTQRAGFFDEAMSWTTSLIVRVANVTLPPPSQWHFHLDLWQHASSIARAHRVPLWSDQHFVIIDRYFAILAERGQKCVTIVASEMPWAGQQCYLETQYPSALFEHGVLDVYERPRRSSAVSSSSQQESSSSSSETELEIDFQHFDRLVALAEKHHMAAEIEVFGLLSIWRDPANGFDTPVEDDSTRTFRRQGSSSSSSGVTSASSKSTSSARQPLDAWRVRCTSRSTHRIRYLRHMAEIERFISLFYEHCVAVGIADRIRVCADEPSDINRFYAQMDFLERLAPLFRVKVAINHLDFLTYAPRQVVDAVPLFPLVCADLEVTRRWRDEIHAKGGKMCWYVCCVPGFPNQFVSSPLVESELMGYLTFFTGLDGFLRWNYSLWPSRPWDDLRWRAPSWRVGDMYFVLPGCAGAPVETLRLEGLRFAVQTYELLRLAQDTLDAVEFDRLKADIAAMIWRTNDWAEFGQYLEHGRHAEDLYSLNPVDYMRARTLLIDALALAHTTRKDAQQRHIQVPSSELPTLNTAVDSRVEGAGNLGRVDNDTSFPVDPDESSVPPVDSISSHLLETEM
ncbi:hypothetical protein PINS_up005828 [Pythium insidiosum]|nr:hypothetical protein PINS_up005828 [Pythium insidiosum]